MRRSAARRRRPHVSVEDGKLVVSRADLAFDDGRPANELLDAIADLQLRRALATRGLGDRERRERARADLAASVETTTSTTQACVLVSARDVPYADAAAALMGMSRVCSTERHDLVALTYARPLPLR